MILEVIQKRKEFSGHSAPIYAICSDDSYLYSASGDKFVCRWNKQLGTQDGFTVKLENTPLSLCLLKETNQLLIGTNSGGIHVIDIDQKKEISDLKAHFFGVFYLLENQTRKQFYSADANGKLCVWSTKSLSLQLEIPTNAGKIRRLHLFDEDQYIALACEDGRVRIFDTLYFNEITSWSAHNLVCTSLLVLDANTFVSGGKDALLKIWDQKTKVNSLSFKANNYVIYDMISLCNGSVLATASRDKSIKLWDTASWKVISKIDFKNGGHKHSVNALLKQNEYSFVSCSDDAKMIEWHLNF